MYQKNKQLKVLALFLDNPYTRFHLRETARKLKMDPMTVKRALDVLVKEGLVVFEKDFNRSVYQANMTDLTLRHIKIAYNIYLLRKRKTTEFLLEQMPPVTAIILFGSMAKGENDLDSDVDLLVISRNKNRPAEELSRMLGREVNLIVFTPAEWSRQASTNRAFYLDILLDGIPLYGNKPVVE